MHAKMLGVLLLMSGGVFAGGSGISFLVIPAVPVDGAQVSAVVNISDCTVLPAQATVVRDGSTIRVEIDVPDYCIPSEVVAQRSYPIGAFSGGRYTVELRSCGNPPPTQPRCTLVDSLTMDVQWAHQGVPMFDRAGLILFAFASLLAGVSHLPRR